ncbi:MAG: hypothetical protein WCJ30_20510 [Deltaproteobacteria bacterium]
MAAAPSTNPRVALIAMLTASVRDATGVGDLAAARVALEALNRLLAEDGGSTSNVVDLHGTRRRKSDEGEPR